MALVLFSALLKHVLRAERRGDGDGAYRGHWMLIAYNEIISMWTPKIDPTPPNKHEPQNPHASIRPRFLRTAGTSSFRKSGYELHTENLAMTGIPDVSEDVFYSSHEVA